VLPGMSQRKHSEVAQLTPALWKASHGASLNGKIVVDVPA
jgi:hypothetical protein